MRNIDRTTYLLRSLVGPLLTIVSLTLGLGLSACATTAGPSTVDLLSQAGFRKVPADTPQKVAHLQTLPDQRLVERTYQGKKYYVYSDPKGCNCLYVGNAAQYQSYQTIVRQQKQANQQWEPQGGVEEDREWEIETAGMNG